MSYAAIRWAYSAELDRSSDRSVLIALAFRADDQFTCYPSQARLSADTVLDRKTVVASLGRLIERGLIADTSLRRGTTGQVIVYRLMVTDAPDEPDSESGPPSPKQPENGTLTPSKPPENGTLRPHETVPFFPAKSPVFPAKVPVFPGKESRFSPKGAQKRDTESPESSVEEKRERTPPTPSANLPAKVIPLRRPAQTAISLPLPDWLPLRAWNDFIEGRRQIRKPMTPKAAELMIRRLTGFHERGINLESALDQSTAAGWQGVFEPKSSGGNVVRLSEGAEQRLRFRKKFDEMEAGKILDDNFFAGMVINHGD